jgi:ribosomal protein S2
VESKDEAIHLLERNRIYIIDLHKTLAPGEARQRSKGRARRRTPLPVATKKQAKQTVAGGVLRCGTFHVSERWLPAC